MADEIELSERESKLVEIMSQKTAQAATTTMQSIWGKIRAELEVTLKKAQDDTVEEVQQRMNQFFTEITKNQSLTMSLSGVIEAIVSYMKKHELAKEDFDEHIKAEMQKFEKNIMDQMEKLEQDKQNT